MKSIERCEAERENGLYNYLYVFILGQMLHGVGGTTIYTVGVALIDDSVKPSSTPLYLGELKLGTALVWVYLTNHSDCLTGFHEPCCHLTDIILV